MAFSHDEVGVSAEMESDQPTLNSRRVRLVYLVTCSQAHLELVPTRDEFFRIVLENFANADLYSPSEVLQWVCSKEVHRDGGVHYHMAVKPNTRERSGGSFPLPTKFC